MRRLSRARERADGFQCRSRRVPVLADKRTPAQSGGVRAGVPAQPFVQVLVHWKQIVGGGMAQVTLTTVRGWKGARRAVWFGRRTQYNVARTGTRTHRAASVVDDQGLVLDPRRHLVGGNLSMGNLWEKVGERARGTLMG